MPAADGETRGHVGDVLAFVGTQRRVEGRLSVTSEALVLERDALSGTAASSARPALLAIEDLSVEFRSMAGTVKAVNGLSMRIERGRTVALVGESGSGKSVTSQAILGLLPKSAVVTSGRILFDDPDLGRLDLANLRGGLGGHTGDDGRAIDTQAGIGFQIGLDAHTSATVRAANA